jgi:sporulation protein YlmC with PRC-barrel domain
MFTGDPDSGTEITASRRLTQEENVASEDRLRELEEKYEDYKVYDNQGERIGKVDDLFVDETDREEYIGVKMGFLGLKSTLIPMDIVRVNEGGERVPGQRTRRVAGPRNRRCFRKVRGPAFHRIRGVRGPYGIGRRRGPRRHTGVRGRGRVFRGRTVPAWRRILCRRDRSGGTDHAPDRGDRDLPGRRPHQDSPPRDTRGDSRRRRPRRPQLERN